MLRSHHKNEENISNANRWRAVDARPLHGELLYLDRRRKLYNESSFSRVDKTDSQESSADADGPAAGETLKVLRFPVQVTKNQQEHQLLSKRRRALKF